MTILQALQSGKPSPYTFRRHWFLHGQFIPEIHPDWTAFLCDEYRDLLHMKQDWHVDMHQILTIYQLARFSEIHGVDETKIQTAITRIEAAARKLKQFFECPRNERSVFEAAWSRLDSLQLEYRTDNPILHDITYPGLSLIIAKTALTRQRLRRDFAPSSLEILILNLATFVERHGWKPTASNSLSKKDDHMNLTPFGRLVKACIECARVEPPGSLTASALNKAIGRVLKKRRDNSA